MLTTTMLLLRSSLFLSLHLSGNASSFPKPLSAEDEQAYLSRCVQGDLEARNILVERNMRNNTKPTNPTILPIRNRKTLTHISAGMRARLFFMAAQGVCWNRRAFP